MYGVERLTLLTLYFHSVSLSLLATVLRVRLYAGVHVCPAVFYLPFTPLLTSLTIVCDMLPMYIICRQLHFYYPLPIQGFPQNSASFRLAQTGGCGYLPNKAMPNTFLGQGIESVLIVLGD